MNLDNLDFGSNFDLGSFEDLAAVDLGNIGGLDLPQGFDPSTYSFDDIDSMINDAALGVGDFSNVEGLDLDSLIDTMGSQGIEGLEDIALGDAIALADMGDFDPLNTYGMTPEQLSNRDELMALGGQQMQITPENQASFDENLTDIMENRGGFTSQWQQVGTDRVMVNDDGTGIGVNENGETYALSPKEVNTMVKSGVLNTAASGYNAATGGTKIAPGGGTPVTLKNGATGTLKPDGKVIDNDSGKQIGTDKDVKGSGDDTKGAGTGTRTGAGTGAGTNQKDGLGALLPLLLALLAMNKGGGGGGGQGAVIPGLTATQKQTPYMQQQRAQGYRPGQGGISYFEPTQYTPKMAAGGGIGSLNRGRLLDGPGDGVSDSIPAVITDGMSKGGQPAKVARGEYIFDARAVAAVGNGSTDAGAERLDKMRENILRDDRKAGVGKDSKAYRHLMA